MLGLLDSDQPPGRPSPAGAESATFSSSPLGLERLGVLTGERTSPLKRLMGTGLRR